VVEEWCYYAPGTGRWVPDFTRLLTTGSIPNAT
jgi:hypothetical protein